MANRTGLSGGFPTRAVLEGVPKIGFNLHTCPFPGSLVACLRYLGDPTDYDYVMGVSGAPFRGFWNRDDGGNIDLMYLAPEPHRRAFDALGYECQALPWDDRAALLDAIKGSIARGRPVLAFGIVGPPECGIVAGYDRGGDVLVGYSYFQDNSLPGYYEQADWYELAQRGVNIAAILIGDRKPRPAERDVLASSLAWAVGLARTPRRPERPDHLCGLAAYDGWADGLEVDDDYPGDNVEVMATRVMVHADQATMLYERRSAARYLRGMAAIAPEAAASLAAAAALYDETADELSGAWPWGDSMGTEVGRDLAVPSIRRDIARHVRVAKAKETRAVEHLERALAALSTHG